MKQIWLVVNILLVLTVIYYKPIYVEAEILEGVVFSRLDKPLPGLTVYLVHPEVGRSSPFVTDLEGRFAFLNVPIREDPYYLEIYWGKDELIFRKNVGLIRGRVTLEPIILQALRSEPKRLSERLGERP